MLRKALPATCHLQLGAFKVKQERLRGEGRDTSQVGQAQEQTIVGGKVTLMAQKGKSPPGVREGQFTNMKTSKTERS